MTIKLTYKEAAQCFLYFADVRTAWPVKPEYRPVLSQYFDQSNGVQWKFIDLLVIAGILDNTTCNNQGSEVKYLQDKLETLKNELREVKRQLLKEKEKISATGKIDTLEHGRHYFMIGQRGQIYSRKCTIQNLEGMERTNSLRRLFLTQAEAEEQKRKDDRAIKMYDELDKLASEGEPK